jgi:hypothetical protein
MKKGAGSNPAPFYGKLPFGLTSSAAFSLPL